MRKLFVNTTNGGVERSEIEANTMRDGIHDLVLKPQKRAGKGLAVSDHHGLAHPVDVL
jgi:hypothetical protein